jgi:PAS domain S-box-containing protein
MRIEVLQRAGMDCTVCAGLMDLVRNLSAGAGAVVLAEESVENQSLTELLGWISAQPVWSDLPILLLLRPGGSAEQPNHAHNLLQSSANLIVLERPIGTVTILSAVRTALRARKRQYDVRAGLAALEESEERTRVLIEALPQLVWTCLPDGKCDYVSKQYLAFTGLASNAQTGLRWLDEVLHPDDQPATLQAWQTALAGGMEYDIEHRLRRADGVYAWFKTRARPMRDPAGSVVRWFGTSTDIGDIVRARQALSYNRFELERLVEERTHELLEANARLKAEIQERERMQAALQQSQKLEAIGQLTSGVAHDFNNLLTAITGNLEIAQRRAEDPRVKRPLSGAERAAARAAQLTHQLLAFSRKQNLAPQALDLNEMLRGAKEILASTVGSRVQVRLTLSDGLWMALVDPSQLKHVVMNLAINSRDAMPTGGQLTISTDNVAPQNVPEGLSPNDYVVLAVTDTGTGMTQDVLSRALDPFFTTKPVGQGSGLGLSMAHGVASQSNGALRIDTTPGHGTTVLVYLPRAKIAVPRAHDRG